ncbi:MAG: hypothetical protein QM755_21730 [Luteolibacter sp.]
MHPFLLSLFVGILLICGVHAEEEQPAVTGRMTLFRHGQAVTASLYLTNHRSDTVRFVAGEAVTQRALTPRFHAGNEMLYPSLWLRGASSAAPYPWLVEIPPGTEILYDRYVIPVPTSGPVSATITFPSHPTANFEGTVAFSPIALSDDPAQPFASSDHPFPKANPPQAQPGGAEDSAFDNKSISGRIEAKGDGYSIGLQIYLTNNTDKLLTGEYIAGVDDSIEPLLFAKWPGEPHQITLHHAGQWQVPPATPAKERAPWKNHTLTLEPHQEILLGTYRIPHPKPPARDLKPTPPDAEFCLGGILYLINPQSGNHPPDYKVDLGLYSLPAPSPEAEGSECPRGKEYRGSLH